MIGMVILLTKINMNINWVDEMWCKRFCIYSKKRKIKMNFISEQHRSIKLNELKLFRGLKIFNEVFLQNTLTGYF